MFGLVAGLVLILMLIGFTVTQYAFRSLEPLYGAAPSELQLRALAVDGAGSAVWEWNARRDEVKVSPVIEASLGLKPGELCTKVDDFIKHLHPTDRERFSMMLWSMQERTGRACASISACATPTTAIAGSSSRRRACRTPTPAPCAASA